MRIEYKFRHSPQSKELKNYVVDKVEKIDKFNIKPERFEVTFSTEKTEKHVDIHVRGQHLEMHARAVGEDYFLAFDLALEKISKQLARKKAKIKTHKLPKAKLAKVS